MIRIIFLVVLSLTVKLPGVFSQASFYRADSVRFSKDSLHFGGTISWPAGKGPFPAIVIISGTGKQNRDGLMAGHTVFKDLAGFLNSKGYAVLRTDDRGVGATNGVYETSTTADFADDALTALEFLKQQPGITRVGLMGHSEGAAAACIAAAKTKDVAFVISIAGLAAPGLEALIAQNRAIVDGTAGISELKRTQLNALNDRVFKTIASHVKDSDSTMINAVKATYNSWRIAYDSLTKLDSVNSFRHRIYFPIDGFSQQAAGKWFRFHIAYDPAAYLPKIKVPVLAINGDRDIMVPDSVHLPYYRKYVTYKKGSLLTTAVIPNMNHLLQQCVTCRSDEYSKPGQQLSPQMLEELGKWLAALVQSQ